MARDALRHPTPDTQHPVIRSFSLLQIPTDWTDYALLDSGEGTKLERFGPYTLVRPEQQAIWRRRLPLERWEAADAVYEKGAGESGAWLERRPLPERWAMRYEGLTFWARPTGFRHTGVFPEQAVQWRWIRQQIEGAGRPIKMLDLFAYTALSTLFAAQAGAQVTYVDASRPALTWARENQEAAGLDDQPIRWILDDATKFVRREARRGATYDALVLDPPVFGRGPKGEIWRFYESVPILLDACRQVLSPQPCFVLINAYAIDVSSVTLANLLLDLLAGYGGAIEAGELGLREESGERVLPAGRFARWAEKNPESRIQNPEVGTRRMA
jgi:23S rRNA (cytosine1962-C5)-methyltransferase